MPAVRSKRGPVHCTIHAATGYAYDKHPREMWRLTLLDRAAAAAAAE